MAELDELKKDYGKLKQQYEDVLKYAHDKEDLIKTLQASLRELRRQTLANPGSRIGFLCKFRDSADDPWFIGICYDYKAGEGYFAAGIDLAYSDCELLPLEEAAKYVNSITNPAIFGVE